MTKNKFILFDFDGVIADSFRSAFEINKMICPHLTEDLYRKKFEDNINNWKAPENFHTKDCRLDIDFFTEYAKRIKNEVKVFGGIKEVIVELEKDYLLIIISSTTTGIIKEFLVEHKLSDYFDWVMGNDVHQSKVEKIKMVFNKYKIKKDNCIFITDTLGDIREAEKMEVGSIAVSWGFNSPDILQSARPFKLVEKPEDILVASKDYFDKLK
jgi:phosphoglycolate phosphatase